MVKGSSLPLEQSDPSPVRTLPTAGLPARYRVQRDLGNGTYGQVYLALDTDLDRDVAIKILRNEYASNALSIQRFLREARYAARVSPHPNVVTVFDLVHAGDLLFIVLEYVQGSDLRTLLARRAPMESSEAVDLMTGILSGLSAAHKRDIIHRDVKPANVLLDDAGRVKLTDFGIAQALMDAHLGPEDVSPGTAAYMSPEQIRNEGVGVQSDLYAAGVIFFEMMTGRRLFTAPTPVEVAVKHLTEPPPSPRSINPSISDAAEAIILRALAKDCRERFASADEMAAAIERLRTTAAGPAMVVRSPHLAPGGQSLLEEEPPTNERTSLVPALASAAAESTDTARAERYELTLRALGAYLDREPSDRISLVEVSDGFLLRRQRSFNTRTETTVMHVTLGALKQLLGQLRREHPRSGRVRHPGMWADFPQGHQDFFRALGHELDAAQAEGIVIDEAEDSLTVTYRCARADGAGQKRISVLRRAQIEHILNAAFERRKNPDSRFGLRSGEPPFPKARGRETELNV